MPKVSVITPAYNGEKYLRLAIDSLLAQSFQDWEWIVVDDGSTDKTYQILLSYNDLRFKVIQQSNAGEAAARNKGLSNATGEYITFLDADDAYLRDALMDLTTFLDTHPEFSVVFSDGYLCDESGRTLARLADYRPHIYTGNILEPLIQHVGAGPIAVNCTMTRRKAIVENGVTFDTNLTIGPDWDFWIQLARFVNFGFLDRLTCLYRIHATNITRTSGKQKRRQDLIKGRLKIMNSEWFNDTTVQTRYTFFYNLVIVLLSGNPADQEAIINSDPFRRLPFDIQSILCRQAGIDALLTQQEGQYAQNFLMGSLKLNPRDRKSALLVKLIKIDQRIAVLIVRFWQMTVRLKNKLKNLFKKGPKAVPLQLQPVGE